MKKVFVFAVAVLSAGIAFCQTINGVALKDINVDYVMIIGEGKFLSNKINISIDFGQETSFFGGNKERKMLDAEGKSITLNSMIDALNFMSSAGYEFVNAYVITTTNNQNVYHWILRKKTNVEELNKYPNARD
ncbi:MAG: hypothetical protein LBH84_09705 [Prevotellaceae bacterium]|jgi:hypothetical protein|nr:hypothetical protein [Prevotellaceae bacterium]